jgi:diguanylate cyclase (GGDEF)-like protein
MFVLVFSLALLPFFVFRLVIGDMQSALVNGATLIVIYIGFAYSWWTGKTAIPRMGIAIYFGLVCIYMIVVADRLPYWLFTIVVANFMLVGWKFALAVNVLTVLGVVTGTTLFEDSADTISFLASVTLVGLFSMIFSINNNFHRDRLKEMVSLDALTGALNRRVLRDDLSDAIVGANRNGQAVAVGLLDLDNFKQVNDRSGHEAGDKVLIDLTGIVKDQSRQADRFYRLGGEEFVLLLNQTDRDGAETAMNKLMEMVRAKLRSPQGPVTVSIGVAMLRPDENCSDWLARADQAMYRAKSEGKDRVVFAD